MARYQQTAAGQAQIASDLKALQEHIRQIGLVYDQFRQIQELNATRAVEQSYALIRNIAVKLTEDAISDVGMTLVTGPMPGLGKIVSEMGKQANDFLGNFNDARKLVNRARALRQLDAMARYADEQMKSLKPALRESMQLRNALIECRQEFQKGAHSFQNDKAQVPENPARNGKTSTSIQCTCEDWNHDGSFGVVLNGSILHANYGPYSECLTYARSLNRCRIDKAPPPPKVTPKKGSCTCEDWDRDGRYGVVLNGKTVLSPNVGSYEHCLRRLKSLSGC